MADYMDDDGMLGCEMEFALCTYARYFRLNINSMERLSKDVSSERAISLL